MSKTIFLVFLNPAAHLRPVSDRLSRIRTLIVRPVVVSVLEMSCRTVANVRKITPRHARVTCGKSRCSIGLYFEPEGGSWATRISIPRRFARF